MGDREPLPGTPRVSVHVQLAPTWGDADLDPVRMLYTGPPHDPDIAIVDVGWTTCGSGIRIRYSEGATFWISRSFDEVWLTYRAPLVAADAAHFLLEPVLAFLLRQRGVLVLHASAVDVGGRGVVVCGPAGAGKSSVAAALVAGGAALLSDDVVGLTLTGEQWWAQRGTPSLRLWDDGAAVFAADVDAVPRFSETWSKRVLSAARLGGRNAAGPAPVALVCVLGERVGSADVPSLESLRGHAAFREIVPHTAANFLHDSERRAEELGQLTHLLTRVPLVRVCIPDAPARVADTAMAVVRLLGA